jgi:ATP-dependent Clp protease ATP-binding subunit ClpC
MFERYTETARKGVFFARYEASQFGSQYIETEHLLLGLLRTDGPLALRLLKAPEKVASIREQIEKQSPRREKLSISVDLPLSAECKRVLAYGAEEAEHLNHKHIAPEHLLLGLLREEQCVASKIMAEYGVNSPQLKQEAMHLPAGRPTGMHRPGEVSRLSASAEGPRDLTAAARNGGLSPLIGRDRELERTIQILARRTKNNPVLIGETGVGKNAIVHGLAQRIADGVVPAMLEDRPILAMDASTLLSLGHGDKLSEIASRGNAILYVHGLFDLAGRGAGWGVREVIHVLEPDLAHQGLQCIATGTPTGLRLALDRAETLTRYFG